MPTARGTSWLPYGLQGRDGELAQLNGVIESAQTGESRALVLHGEPGIGKTALLDHVIASASDVRVLRFAGVESEMELPFAAVHQLCRPMLDRLDRLPDLQREALKVVFGLIRGPAPDLYLVGLAVLGLLCEAAEEQAVICVIDDGHWLDHASVRVLGFVARRLLAERVALIFAMRQPSEELRDLPQLELGGLSKQDSRALLAPVAHLLPDERVLDRIVAETHGNPLALIELPRGMTAAQLAGGLGVLGAENLSGRIEDSFLQRLADRGDDTRVLLLVAAAEPTGDPLLVWRAAEQLGVVASGASAIETDGLLTIGQQVTFRHPLVRSAVYRSGSTQQRREAHLALAGVTDPEFDPDRRAWHLAAAAPGPDEAVAAELERSAGRAQARGGFGAAAALLERSVALSRDPVRRSERTISAARANVRAGAFEIALTLLATARTGPLDEAQRAHVDLLSAEVIHLQRRGVEAPVLLLQAAKALEPLDPDLARRTYLEAWGAATFAGRFGRAGSLGAVSRAARTAPPPIGAPAPSDLLLDGLSLLFTDGREAATPVLRRAVGEFAENRVRGEALLRWGWLGTAAACLVWEHDASVAIATRCVQEAHDTGALSVLVVSLDVLAQVITVGGELAAAEQLVSEGESVAAATERAVVFNCALVVAAFRGADGDLDFIDDGLRKSTAAGQGNGVKYAYWARAMILNALGRYDEALADAQQTVTDTPQMFLAGWAAGEVVEAATRLGQMETARSALPHLVDHTQASRTDWALGVEARARALLAEGAGAERWYEEALDRFVRARLRPDLARSHLVYGEWLRRQDRRTDAREQLRAAHGIFVDIGMQAYAGRARAELLATGERVRIRAAQTRDQLTAQERQIAALARDGLSNHEIGGRLFLSHRTVEWHLRKVFAKLGIGSRKELAQVLPTEPESTSL